MHDHRKWKDVTLTGWLAGRIRMRRLRAATWCFVLALLTGCAAGRPAPDVLAFRLVNDVADGPYRIQAFDPSDSSTIYLHEDAVLGAADIDTVRLDESDPGARTLAVRFHHEGRVQFARVTSANVGRRLAIVHDGRVLAAPRIMATIESGRARIDTDEDPERLLRELGEAGITIGEPLRPAGQAPKERAPVDPTDVAAQLRQQRDFLIREVRPVLDGATLGDSLVVMTLGRMAGVLELYDPDPAEQVEIWELVGAFWPTSAPRDLQERVLLLDGLVGAKVYAGDLSGADILAEQALVLLEDAADRGRALDASELDGLVDLATAHVESGRDADAEELCERVLAADPHGKAVPCLLTLTGLLRDQGRTTDLRRLCEAEIELSDRPGNVGARAVVATRLLEQLARR